MTPRWTVRKHGDRWKIIDPRGCWVATFDTLTEAHTEATQNAAAETLYSPGGLTRLARLLILENWADWAARHG